jgi:hypothetical protein
MQRCAARAERRPRDARTGEDGGGGGPVVAVCTNMLEVLQEDDPDTGALTVTRNTDMWVLGPS